MSKTLKLMLDILIGAAIPILVLKYGTASLGPLNAYLTAAMIPVVWVLLDLLVITRRFNFITAFVGLTSLMRGGLAFWYVDGLLFALKDSASYVVSFLVFGATALLGSPVTRSMVRVSCVSMRVAALPSTSARWPVSSPMRMTSMAWESRAWVFFIA